MYVTCCHACAIGDVAERIGLNYFLYCCCSHSLCGLCVMTSLRYHCFCDVCRRYHVFILRVWSPQTQSSTLGRHSGSPSVWLSGAFALSNVCVLCDQVGDYCEDFAAIYAVTCCATIQMLNEIDRIQQRVIQPRPIYVIGAPGQMTMQPAGGITQPVMYPPPGVTYPGMNMNVDVNNIPMAQTVQYPYTGPQPTAVPQFYPAPTYVEPAPSYDPVKVV
jgi:hypothetical protein